jgi:RNA polymerase sigma-70 factor (ECF subfamily)
MNDSSQKREEAGAASVTSLGEPLRRQKFDAFAREHSGFLRGLAMKLCRAQFDPQDLVQDVLERAWNHFDDVPTANPRAWLARVMHNLFIDWARKRQSGPKPVAIEDVPLATPPPPQKEWWDDVTAEEVRAKAELLGDELRDAFVLHVFEDCSYITIAKRLNIPKATVGTRLLRARRKLKRLLSEGRAPEPVEDAGE